MTQQQIQGAASAPLQERFQTVHRFPSGAFFGLHVAAWEPDAIRVRNAAADVIAL